jgi:hypothetical protein
VKNNVQTSSTSPNNGLGGPNRIIDDSCITLISLAESIPQRGMDKTARTIAGALCSYVDTELSQHRKDDDRQELSSRVEGLGCDRSGEPRGRQSH